MLAIGTCVVGAALVVAAFVGRAHTLILVGIAARSPRPASSNTIDVPLRGGIGSRAATDPSQRSELQSHYELGIGELKLDLRDVPLSGRTTTVDAQTGIGHLLVFVPSSVRVEVHAHAGAGSVELFGQRRRRLARERRARRSTAPARACCDSTCGSAPAQVEVRRFEPGGVETILGRGN